MHWAFKIKKTLGTQGILCLSVSPLHTAGLQGVVSVEVASLSLHKKRGSGF